MRLCKEICYSLNLIADKCQNGLAGFPEAQELRNIVGELQTISKTLQTFKASADLMIQKVDNAVINLNESRANLSDISYLSRALAGTE